MTGMDGLPTGVTTGLGLVMQVRAWENSRESVSAGAVALADWIVDERDTAEAMLADPLCPLRGRLLLRVLAGTVLPGEAQGEWLGRATGGRVIARMFRQAFAGAVPELEAMPELEAGEAPEPPVAPAPLMLCEIPGPLGTIPRGPLFAAIADPMVAGEFVLAGLGLGLRLSEATASAMKRALEDGIEQIAADRFATLRGAQR